MSEQVKAVPDGFHTITPAIVVRGAAKAIDFYKQAFGAEVIGRMDAPDGKVMHAEIRIGNSMLMLSDEYPEWGANGPETIGGTPVSLCLYVEDCDTVFNRAVEEGATIKMPPSDQFWGDRYAKVSDPFGHTWSIATHIKDLTHDEVMQAAAVAMSGAASATE
jgi:uncharacterized glyoxalase superfamily protein PhnB